MSFFKTAPAVRFQNSKHQTFANQLKSRVNEYFQTQNISRHANSTMIVKTIVMYAMYIIPLVSIFYITQYGWLLFAYFVMGIAMAGLGFSVMHDANHGAYSQKPWVNQLIGYTLNFIGGNAINWKIQHNVFHHTYTNIVTHDEDIRPRFIMRFSPHAKLQWFHKYQHIYAWLLYGFMTISWLLVKDFVQLAGYTRSGVLKKYENPVKSWTVLLISKFLFYGYIIALPVLFTPFGFWQIVLGFLLMQYVGGFILAIVFQPAHVIESNLFPEANEDNLVEENFLVHQLQTTCNFANRNKWLTWYVGGLNFQIEHHLFPSICHVHYPSISKIVKSTAQEFGIPYHDIGSFRQALQLHGRMLYQLGRAE